MNERERERERERRLGSLEQNCTKRSTRFDFILIELTLNSARRSLASPFIHLARNFYGGREGGGEGVYHSILFDEFVYAFERHGRIVSKRDGKILEIFSTMLLKEEIYMYIYSLDVIVYGKIGTSIFYSRYTNIHLVSRIMTFVF